MAANSEHSSPDSASVAPRILPGGTPGLPATFKQALGMLVDNPTFRAQVLATPKHFVATFPDLDFHQISILVQVGEAAGFNIPYSSSIGFYCCCCCGFPGMPTRF